MSAIRFCAKDIRETCLQLFLNCIPKKQRIAFTLKILRELSISEVADIMGISEVYPTQIAWGCHERGERRSSLVRLVKRISCVL